MYCIRQYISIEISVVGLWSFIEIDLLSLKGFREKAVVDRGGRLRIEAASLVGGAWCLHARMSAVHESKDKTAQSSAIRQYQPSHDQDQVLKLLYSLML